MKDHTFSVPCMIITDFVMEARPFFESQIKIKDSSRYLLSKIPVLQQSAVGSSLVGEFTLCLAMMWCSVVIAKFSVVTLCDQNRRLGNLTWPTNLSSAQYQFSTCIYQRAFKGFWVTYFPFALLCPNPLNISDVYLTYVGEHEHLNNFWSELLEAGDGPIVGDEWRPVAAERVTEHLRHRAPCYARLTPPWSSCNRAAAPRSSHCGCAPAASRSLSPPSSSCE